MPISSTPTFRSLSTIVGDMVSTFLSELDRNNIVPGIQSLKPGSPYLAIFESTGQSQFRNQEQTLSLLDANDLDIAHGERLDRIGAAEKLLRRGATFATGYVNISDTSFTKVSTRVYQGKPAPIPGSVTIYVADATGFGTTGNLYIGRNTPNLEGPLAYTACVNAGSYWTITLAAGTTNFHGLGEGVVFAQGGDRVITAGQSVTTPQGNSATYAKFTTTAAATLLDGETSVLNVHVASTVPGAEGNASAGGVKVIPSPAFTGMAVTNPLPITNGLDVENDDLYRERIKAARRSRVGTGTVLGINVHSYGVQAPDEAATVVSSQYLFRQILPSLLVIDDGTGYEAKESGIAYEVLMDSAIGGEDVFFLNHGQPVAKASLTTVLAAPYPLANLDVLTVKVGGVTYSHSFDSTDFLDITNATAYEVVASINSNPTIPYSARTSGAGTKVAIFAKANTNDDIEVVAGGANVALSFPPGVVEALRLYKNDYLLSKDGTSASLTSADQSMWSGIVSGDTLTISVDGTPSITYTFTDNDVIDLGLGYATLSNLLPLSAWVSIFNNKVPGVTCALSGSSLTFTSNLGPSARASVTIDPASSLVTKGVFNPLALTSSGRAKDFVLDRNRGQIDLTQPLVAGDQLTAGSSFTRAYFQSASLLALSVVPVGGANFWFTVDGDAVRIPHTLNASHRVNQFWDAGGRTFISYTGIVTPAFCFRNVQVGDYAIWTEDMWAAAPATFSVMRINWVALDGSSFRCDYPTTGLGTASGFNNAALPAFERLFFVRASAIPQHVTIAAGNYSPTALAAAVTGLTGATVSIERNKLRITTNTFSTLGDIALSAQDVSALTALGFTVGSSVQNDEPETAAVESGNSDVGTPRLVDALTAYVPPLEVLSDLSVGVTQRDIVGALWLRAVGSDTFLGVVTTASGTNTGDSAEWTSYVAGNVFLDHLLAQPRAAVDVLAAVSRYRVGPISDLNVVFDNDPVTKGYSIPMTRWLKTDPSVPYGINLRLVDADNSNGSLALAFGTSFDFSNFVLHGRGRGRVNLALTQPASTDVVMLRWNRWSGATVNSDVYIVPPNAASAALDVAWDAASDNTYVYLASGADRGDIFTYGSHHYVGQGASTATLVSAFNISNIARVGGNTVTVTLGRPTADILFHGITPGAAIYLDIVDANFASGLQTVTAVADGFPGATLTYIETGANVSVANPPNAYLSRGTPFVPDYSAVQVGDIMSLKASNVFLWSVPAMLAGDRARAQVVAKSPDATPRWVRLATGVFNTGWGFTWSSTDDIRFFPLTANTTTAVIAAINALTTSTVSATLASGPGTGLISKVWDDINFAVATTLRDSLLYIASATYNAAPGVLNYDITLKVDVEPGLAVAPNDWANEEFRLAPTTAKNVADYLNRGQVTGLASTGASIKASSNGRKVQLASGTLGSGGAVQVTGGTANSASFPVISTSLVTALLSAVVATNSGVDSLSPQSNLMLTNTDVLPKVLDWTAATILSATLGEVVVSGAGKAWTALTPAVQNGPSWLWSDAGNFKVAFDSSNTLTFSDGGWVRFEPGWGKWKPVGSRANALVGAAYVTLPSGKTMSIGGVNDTQLASVTATSNAVELYDPVAETWSTLAVLPAVRAFGAAAYIPSLNKVLFAGGIHNTAPGVFAWHAEAWLYDITGNSWAATGPLSAARSHFTLTTMSTNEVVAVGGMTSLTASTNSVNVYSPLAFTFSVVASMAKARGTHSAFLYGIDQLLVVGGFGPASTGYETFALNALAWSNDSAFASGLVLTAPTVVALSSTKFLVAGGITTTTVDFIVGVTQPTRKAEVYDVVSHTAAAVGDLVIPLAAGNGAAIPTNKVLVWGGAWGMPLAGVVQYPLPHGISQVYDIASDTWTLASASKLAHVYAPALNVDGTTVTVAGSALADSNVPSAGTERFDSAMLAAPAGNTGTFRALRGGGSHVVIEAPASVAGEWDYAYVRSYTYDSLMPGDVLNLSSGALGTAPAGSYTVLSTDFSNVAKFTVTGSGTWATGAFGTALPLVRVIARSPARMLYSVQYIGPSADAGQTSLRLYPSTFQEQFSAAAGSVLVAQDKLAFPTTLVPGQDGYRYNTGLIAEVTKVVYGDERDTVTYPGYASAGAAIDVSAPLIRRVLISLAIRARSGAVDIKSRVQSAVAKVVNSAAPGPIALSLIIEAVQQVDGIISVVLLSPVATTTADTIPVQPYEKALVLDPTNDVTVSLIGA
jgi:uncharacterized phage protein gp47/JayE